jgi:hypothetical protein
LPIKSWAFTHRGHPVRAEICWRFTGWNRKRLYVDHRRAVGKIGRFTLGRPITAEITGGIDKKEVIQIRFRPRRFFFDMGCQLLDESAPPVPVPDPQIEKRWQLSAVEGIESSSRWQAVGCAIVLPLFFVLAVLSIPMALIAVNLHWWHGRRLQKRMRDAGRSLTWEQVEKQMKALQSPSTLILQFGHMSDTRAWWTVDDILTHSPLKFPKMWDLLHPSASECNHPFTEWCHSKYLDEQSGKAFLVQLPKGFFDRFAFEQGELDQEQLHREYPLLNTVMTGYSVGKRKKAAARFTGIVGDDLKKAMPDLIAAIEDSDPAIRHMCMEALTQAASDAAGAAPRLKQKLYFGPWNERHIAAKTLAALGPEGVNILKEAAELGDPKISRSAKSAIWMYTQSEERSAEVPTPRVHVPPELKQERRLKDRRRTRFAIGFFCVALLAFICGV